MKRSSLDQILLANMGRLSQGNSGHLLAPIMISYLHLHFMLYYNSLLLCFHGYKHVIGQCFGQGREGRRYCILVNKKGIRLSNVYSTVDIYIYIYTVTG